MESLAQSFDVAVEIVLIENLIQSYVERMRGKSAADLGSPPTLTAASRAAFVCPIAIGDSIVRGINRILVKSRLTTGR